MEKVEAGGIAIGCRAVTAGSFYRERDKTIVRRTEIAVFIDNADGDVGKVFTVGSKPGAVGNQFQMMRFAGGTDDFLFCRFAGSILSHDFQFARFIRNIHPHQAVAALQGKRVLAL